MSARRQGPRRSPRALVSLALVVVGIAFSVAPTVDAKNSGKSSIPYSEPTPSEGGQVVRYNLTVGVGKRAPDCYLRDVYTINGRFVGPTIEVHRGDVLHVTLKNEVPPDYPQVHVGVTLHWHGLSMEGSDAWYDGVAFLHQCPLQNAKGFDNRQEIKFRVVDGPGTYWYHSHSGVSSADGVFGPLLIRPPRTAKPGQAGEHNDVGPGRAIEKEFPVLFGDWFHGASGALAFQLGRPYDARKANATTGDYDWVNLPQSMLVNGRGVYQDCALKGPLDNTTTCLPVAAGAVPPGRSKFNPFATPSNPGCARSNFTVSAGKRYLFRLVNVGSLTDASLCFGGHDRVSVVAADGVPVEPFDVVARAKGQGACVEVNLGQRVDVVLEATGEPGSAHWVTAAPHFRAGAPNGFAVLRYESGEDVKNGASSPSALPDPATAPQPGSVAPWTLDELRRFKTPAWLRDRSVDPPEGVVPELVAPLKKRNDTGDGRPSLSVPPKPDRVITVNMTQPFLPTGQVRWALNQVVSTDTPACNEYMRVVRDRGFDDAVAAPARSAARAVVAAADAVARNSPPPRPQYPDVGVSMGVQEVAGDRLDSRQAPTFLSYGRDASGERVFAPGEGGNKDESDKNVDLVSTLSIPTPQVGRHLVPLRQGEVVDVVYFNQYPDTNQGPYDRPKDAPVNVEMHPMHLHGTHFFVLGFGWGEYDEKNATNLNLIDPPYRDTAMVPGFRRDRGWLRVRFVADNPGVWLNHCHVLWHAYFGQALAFAVAPDRIPAAPRGLPKCPSRCAASIAPWDQAYVDKTWGTTNYDIGPVANRPEVRV